jgi:hypothetical protein
MQVTDETREDLLSLVQKEWGYQVAIADVDDLVPKWLTYEARKIPRVTRNVKVSVRVSGQETTFPAISKITHALESGGDLTPYLSRSIFKKPPEPCHDRFFLDWQISHFHLGERLDDLNSVTRTEPVLLAYVEGQDAFLLDLKKHGSTNPLLWVDEDILRALGELAPQVLARSELKGVQRLSWSPTAKEKLVLRKLDANVPIEVDGKYYVGPGQGMTTASTGLRFQRFADRIMQKIEELTGQLERDMLSTETAPLMQSSQNTPAILGISYHQGRICLVEKHRDVTLLCSAVIS